jgi:PhnB protein
MSVKAIPEDFHSLTAYLMLQNAAEAIDFYQKAFDATEQFRLDTPDGRVGHAQLRIGSSVLMLSEPCGEGPLGGPDAQTRPAFGLYLYVEDADAVFDRAVKAGAESVMPMTDMFYGDRSGTLKDPYGHIWFIATHKEDLTPDEIHRRAAEMFKTPPKA